MSLPIDIYEIGPKLVQVFESEHFLIHYELRNPATGKGLGPHGVRDKALVATYRDALESLYATMTAAPWSRDPPIVGPEGKTHVYICNSDEPFTTYDLQNVPYIVLTSRNNEPTTKAELHRAAAEAVHEATHLFNYNRRPLYNKIIARRWEWFDEGLAVLMEMLVIDDNSDHFRFLPDWIDTPELSLDHPTGTYQAGMFMHYIAKRLGLEFVNDVWMKSDQDEEPLKALQRLTPANEVFFSSDSAVRDIFGSGYSIDPYCLWEHASEVYVRFGERAVSESLLLPDENGREIDGYQLDHLSCRYYRLYLKEGVSNVEVTMSVEPWDTTPLKAEVFVVTIGRQRDRIRALRPCEDDIHKFSCNLDKLNPAEIDHIVLVVSNCGTNLSLNGHAGGRDDGRTFRINCHAS